VCNRHLKKKKEKHISLVGAGLPLLLISALSIIFWSKRSLKSVIRRSV
jgi:hypothetical protein